MDQTDIEKFKRQMGKGVEIQLVNEDETTDNFYFKPLNTEFLPDIMEMQQLIALDETDQIKLEEAKRKFKIRKITQNQFNDIEKEMEVKSSVKSQNPEVAKIGINLIGKMVIHSYPDLPEDIRNQFIMNNFSKLQEVLMELNKRLTSRMKSSKMEKIKELQERIGGSNEKASTEK